MRGFLLLSDIDLWCAGAMSPPTPVMMEAWDAAEMPPDTDIWKARYL